MVKEYILVSNFNVNIMEIGIKEINMDWVYQNIKMDLNMRVILIWV